LAFNLLLAVACWSRFTHQSEAVSSPAHGAGNPPPQLIEKLATNGPVAHTLPIWGAVESHEYERYVANLRAVGCPEKTVRDIVVAELNELCEKRFLQEFPSTNAVAYWKPRRPVGQPYRRDSGRQAAGVRKGKTRLHFNASRLRLLRRR